MHFVFTGPESSGKTTLTNLAYKNWGGVLVKEAARDFLTAANGFYQFSDLKAIALRQLDSEVNPEAKNSYIWCDTDLLTIIIWSLDKFGTVDPEILLKWENLPKDDRFYFLCFPDVPWEYDSLRENPLDRNRIYEIYQQYLHDYNLSYQILKGELNKRLTAVEDTFLQYVNI